MSFNFGKFTLLEQIATGGMAEIWLAKQNDIKGFERVVVIKKTLPQLTQDQEFVTMLLDEARIAAKLNHSNVVQIFDLGKQNNTYYIAMEYIFGEDLRSIMIQSLQKNINLTYQLIIDIIAQAAEGLHYAHTLTDIYGHHLGIVHRDISPQNILVSYNGIVKIVDFGIAKAATRSQKTEAGILKGKIAYMSPEQAMGYKLDNRSDLFALGIVLYELTLGRRPFVSDSGLRLLKMITEDPVVRPRKINPKYPPELERILLKLLEKKPQNRYQTGKEVAEDLRKFSKKYPPPIEDLKKWMSRAFNEKMNETKARHKALLSGDAKSYPSPPPTSSSSSKTESVKVPRGSGKFKKNFNNFEEDTVDSYSSSNSYSKRYNKTPAPFKEENTINIPDNSPYSEEATIGVNDNSPYNEESTIGMDDNFVSRSKRVALMELAEDGGGTKVDRSRGKKGDGGSIIGKLFTLIIAAAIAYSVYFGGYFAYHYFTMNSKLNQIAQKASMMTDDDTITNDISNLCKKVYPNVICINETILINRDVSPPTISLKYYIKFKILWTWPYQKYFTPVVSD